MLEKALAGVLIGITYAGIIGILVKFLWNSSLAPAFDNVNPITYWQGIGIVCLCVILFKPPTINAKEDQ